MRTTATPQPGPCTTLPGSAIRPGPAEVSAPIRYLQKQIRCRRVGFLQATSGDGGSYGGNNRLKGLGGGGDGDGAGPELNMHWLMMALTCCFCLSLDARPAHALLGIGRKPKPKRKAPEVDVDKLVDLSWPILKNLGFSGVLGVTAAIAFKTVGRALAVVVGMVFGIVQLGAYMGYVQVDWSKVHKDVIRSFDVNQDGKFDASDFTSLTASLLAVLSQGVPSIGGFMAGFTWGLRL